MHGQLFYCSVLFCSSCTIPIVEIMRSDEKAESKTLLAGGWRGGGGPETSRTVCRLNKRVCLIADFLFLFF